MKVSQIGEEEEDDEILQVSLSAKSKSGANNSINQLEPLHTEEFDVNLSIRSDEEPAIQLPTNFKNEKASMAKMKDNLPLGPNIGH